MNTQIVGGLLVAVGLLIWGAGGSDWKAAVNFTLGVVGLLISLAKIHLEINP